MDRRQKRTRNAIFNAFTDLLSQKPLNKITVEEIITNADIGRATFYSHFETKDFLLKELCDELFCHVFDKTKLNSDHRHIFDCEANDCIFLHTLKHIENNDNQILKLLSSQNNALFLTYFKQSLLELIKKSGTGNSSNRFGLPEDFYINHITSTFIETLRWWIDDNKRSLTVEQIHEYFLCAINI